MCRDQRPILVALIAALAAAGEAIGGGPGSGAPERRAPGKAPDAAPSSRREIWRQLCPTCGERPPDPPELPPVPVDADPARPFVVEIRADWCMNCALIEPVWTELHRELGSRVRMVVLDVSDRQRLERAAREARRLGLDAFFARFRARTGTVGILDGATRKPVRILFAETSLDPYREGIERATRPRDGPPRSGGPRPTPAR